jgi:hypothetical protein
MWCGLPFIEYTETLRPHYTLSLNWGVGFHLCAFDFLHHPTHSRLIGGVVGAQAPETPSTTTSLSAISLLNRSS